MLLELEGKYYANPNKESGIGRHDIMLKRVIVEKILNVVQAKKTVWGKVIRLYYGLDGEKLNFNEIGERLGISATMAINRINYGMFNVHQLAKMNSKSIFITEKAYTKRLQDLNSLELSGQVDITQIQKERDSLNRNLEVLRAAQAFYFEKENIFDREAIVPAFSIETSKHCQSPLEEAKEQRDVAKKINNETRELEEKATKANEKEGIANEEQ